MDQPRKRAYHYLLYRVMRDVRESTFFVARRARWWNPQYWRRTLYVLRRIHALSDWLNDMALASANDFEGFDEKQFWKEMERLGQEMPDLELDLYKDVFERALSGP